MYCGICHACITSNTRMTEAIDRKAPQKRRNLTVNISSKRHSDVRQMLDAVSADHPGVSETFWAVAALRKFLIEKGYAKKVVGK